MENSKLAEVLRTFSKDELKEFEKLVVSPFFNNDKNSVLLLKELKKFHPGFSSKNLTKENLFSRIYPGKKYNDQVMKNAISILMKMCNEYFFEVNLRKEKLE
jgi:hypothetical protein